ncbi:MAG TPA: YaiI/YqxD family protein [Xanthobacteraceae bacterium]
MSSSPAAPKSITIYVDADACPVKQEIYRVAERHALKGVALKVFVVSNSPIAVPRDMGNLLERVVVGAKMDEADNWIAERAGAGDIVITADVPLASRSVKAGAEAIAPNGRPFTKDSIGMTLASRNLMDSLRSAGEITGGPKPFAPRDRSAFLSALDQAIVRLTRAGFGSVAPSP